MATKTTSSGEIIDLFQRYVVGNYTRYPVALTHGENSWVWDAEGKRYLDFFPGWGCHLIGHAPPRVAQTIAEQARTLIHVPNTWYMEPMLAGFQYAPFGDLAAAAKLIDGETCAIMLEPIQGEGGIHLPPPGYLE